MTPANAPLPIRPPADLVALELVLHVTDRDVRAELEQHEEGRARHDFALDALRIGVLALRQAQGRIDADHVRAEGERLIEHLATALRDHHDTVSRGLDAALQTYFDPANGRFHERVERLVRRDGELEQVLRRQVGGDDSALAATLSRHVGENSALAGKVRELLQAQRETLLKEFSLDNKQGALARLIGEIRDHNGKLGTDLRDRLAGLVREFSLDDAGSALARVRRELMDVFAEEREESRRFREQVRETLVAQAARKEEAARSTRHGLEFEDAVHRFVEERCARTGDLAVAVGATPGPRSRCKKGDTVVELGPEHAAAGARIVVEAKEREHVSLADAVAELVAARENRDAQVGLFVFSRRVAPDEVGSLVRFGNDVVVAWDADDPGTDACLVAGLEVARALCAAVSSADDARAADLAALDAAIVAVEKHAQGLDEIARCAGAVRTKGQTILTCVDRMRHGLARQIGILRDNTERLKGTQTAPAPKRRRGRKS